MEMLPALDNQFCQLNKFQHCLHICACGFKKDFQTRAVTYDLCTFFIEVYQTQHGPRHSNYFAEMNLKTVCSETLALHKTYCYWPIAKSCS